MKGNILIVDKKTEFNTFRYERKIRSPQFQEGIDYSVSENGSVYNILSSQLKKDILITQNPYHDNIDVSGILSMKILVDHQDGINIKPKIVTDLEQREGLIEVGRGINNFPRSLPPIRGEREFNPFQITNQNFLQITEMDNNMDVDKPKASISNSLTKVSLLSDDEIEKASKDELISLIKRINKSLEIREKVEANEANSSSFQMGVDELKKQKQKSQQKLEKLEKLEKSYSFNKLDNSPKSSNLIIGGVSLVLVVLISFLLLSRIKCQKQQKNNRHRL